MNRRSKMLVGTVSTVLLGASMVVSAATTQAARRTTTVTLMSWSPLSTTMTQMVKVFEARHPNIKINATIQPSSTYWTSLKAAAASGSLPDIIGLAAGSYTQLYRPLLEPLNPIASKLWGPKWQKEFPPATRSQMVLGNPAGNHNTYILPEEAEALNVWYNTQIFKQLHLSVPKTLPELIKDAKAISKAGYIPFYQGAESANFDWWMYMEFAYQLDPRGMAAAELGKPTWTQPGMIEAMQTWKTLATDGAFQSGMLADFQYPTGANLFAAGRVGMMLLGSWWLQEAKLPPPQPKPVNNLQDFSFFPFPAIKAGGHPSPYIGGIDVGWGVTKAARKHQAAVDLVLKSLIQGSMEHVALNTLNDMPAFKGLKPSIPLDPHMRQLYTRYEAILPHTVSHEIGSPVISQALVNAMQAVAAGKLSPKAAMIKVNDTAKAQAR